MIPCNELIIGSWRRETHPHETDLLVYYSMAEQRLSYVVCDAQVGYSARISVPFSIISSAELSHESNIHLPPDSVHLLLHLSAPPTFFMEISAVQDLTHGTSRPVAVLANAETYKMWTPCQDWTEGKQGKCLRHVLTGPGGRDDLVVEAHLFDPGAARRAAVGIGVDDQLGAAGERRVGGRIHVAEDHVGLQARPEHPVGAAIDGDDQRPLVADVLA